VQSRRRFCLLSLLFLLVAVVPCRPVGAASVPYVGSVAVGDDAEHPGIAGKVIAERSVPFLLIDARFDAEYDLTLQNFVAREAGTGTLDFYYRVTNGSNRPLRLIDMDTGRFTRAGSFDPIDVNLWDETTGTYAPLLADRSRSHFGGVALVVPADETLDPGESSRLFFIRTGATRYELEGLTQFRSTPDLRMDAGFALTFSPVLDGPLVPPPAATEVPLPAGLLPALLTLGLAGATRRRRRARC
jgi:hypothetical protein